MPQETQKFKFPYFQSGDVYSPSLEEIRWKTLDENLAAIMQLLGNGVVEGWQCQGEINVSKEIVMRPGYGVVSGFAARTPEDILIDLTGRAAGNYKLILLDTPTTYYDASVSYDLIPAAAPGPPGSVEIAQMSIDTSGTLLALADTRKFIGITQQIIDAINNHVHNGAPGNPAKISLSAEVEGVLPEEHLPDIPTSKLTGPINPDLINNFSHKSLRDIGDLSHLELDEIAKTYNKSKFQYLGVINAVNLILAIIRRMDAESSSAILKYLSNVRAILPGVSPAGWVDTAASTATIDTSNRRILGVAGTALDPSVAQRLTIDKKTGTDGFLGPSVKSIDNLDVEQDELGEVKVALRSLTTTRYYYSNGSFYVDFNAGSVVQWLNVEYKPVVIGTSAELGSENGPSITLYGKSGISQRSLGTTNWVQLASSPETSAQLNNIPGSRWLRLRFDITRGSTTTANVIIQEITVTYSIGSSGKCSFLIYPMLDKWEDDEMVKELIEVDKTDDSLFIYPITKYYIEAEYISRVICCEAALAEWGSIFLSYDRPPGTNIEVYIRSANSWFSETDNTIPWVRQEFGEVIKISKPHSTFTDVRQSINEKAIQIKIVLKSYKDSSGIEYTPKINGLSLNYYIVVPDSSYSNPFDVGAFIDSTGFFEGESFSASQTNSPFYPLILRHPSNPNIEKLPIYIDNIDDSQLFFGYVGYTGGLSNNYDTSLDFCESRVQEWHTSGTSKGSWREQGAFLDNVTDSKISGAITLIDPAKPGSWVSPPFKVSEESRFLGWDTVEIAGPNVSQITAIVEFSNDVTPTTWKTAGTYSDPYAKGVLRIPFLIDPVYRKYKWIRIRVNLRS
jgi:hypothetical protein